MTAMARAFQARFGVRIQLDRKVVESLNAL